MSIDNILTQLREEHRLLEQAILALEELARGRKRGPGRPLGRPAHQEHIEHIEYREQVVSAAAAD